ncbi:MAG: YdcF family protein, partial [Anditalea sp.]
MFFYLSQFLSFLVMPLTIIILLFVGGIIFINKRTGKRLMLCGSVLLLFFSNQFMANYAMYLWEPD